MCFASWGCPAAHPPIFRKSSPLWPRPRSLQARRGSLQSRPKCRETPCRCKGCCAIRGGRIHTGEGTTGSCCTRRLPCSSNRTDGFVGELGPSKPTQTSPTCQGEAPWGGSPRGRCRLLRIQRLGQTPSPVPCGSSPIRLRAIPQCGCPPGGRGLRWCVSGRPSCFLVGRR